MGHRLGGGARLLTSTPSRRTAASRLFVCLLAQGILSRVAQRRYVFTRWFPCVTLISGVLVAKIPLSVRPLVFRATWKHTFNIYRLQTSLSTWHASFVTRCKRLTSPTTASILLVEATDTPISLILRENMQRPADSS